MTFLWVSNSKRLLFSLKKEFVKYVGGIMFYNYYVVLWEAVHRPLQSLLQTCQKARDDKDIAMCPTLPHGLEEKTGTLHFLIGNKIENNK